MVSEPSLNQPRKSIFLSGFLLLFCAASASIIAQEPAQEKPPEPAPVSAQASDEFLQCQNHLITQIEGVPFEYIAEIKSLKVVSKRWLEQQEDQRWKLQSRAQWLFLGIYERSIFELPNWQLHSFLHERKGLSEKHNLNLQVDHQAQQLVVEARNKTKRFDYSDDVLDELSHQLRLQIDVACQSNADEFFYAVAKRKGVKPFHYKKLATEIVNTEAGKFEAIKLEKLDDDRTTYVWLAPELAYAIVKLVHEEDGDRNSLSIKVRPELNTGAGESQKPQ